MGRVVNVPGIIRAKEISNGVCELTKEPDVLCVLPAKKSKSGLYTVLASGGVIGGLAAVMIYLAPALGVIVFGLVAWCCFAAAATGEERN